MSLRNAVLVKQIPAASGMAPGADGRLLGAELGDEMNAYGRRPVSKVVEAFAAALEVARGVE